MMAVVRYVQMVRPDPSQSLHKSCIYFEKNIYFHLCALLYRHT